MRKKVVSFVAALIICNLIPAQQSFKQFQSKLIQIKNKSEKQALIDEYLKDTRLKKIPLIEKDSAIFIYTGEAEKVQIAGDFSSWRPYQKPFKSFDSTNLFYLKIAFESDARMDYKLVIDDSNWILDPLNPSICEGGFGPNSEFAMPDYQKPPEIVSNENISKGTMVTDTLLNIKNGNKYRVDIYLPKGYNRETSEKYSTVYFQDGQDYIRLGKAVTILDNLIGAKKIQPLVAVFVTPKNRNSDYAYNDRFIYSEFFASVVVPYVDKNYKTINDKFNRLILGDSFGANISALISYKYPEIFALCGLHSPAFWPNDYEVYNLLVGSKNLDTKFAAVWGSYEGELSENARNFFSEMKNKNVPIFGKEFNEGHSWGLWKATTDLILEYFYPLNK